MATLPYSCLLATRVSPVRFLIDPQQISLIPLHHHTPLLSSTEASRYLKLVGAVIHCILVVFLVQFHFGIGNVPDLVVIHNCLHTRRSKYNEVPAIPCLRSLFG